ncbi:uncharacterized protein CTRU02_201293 [Colletotrichum truncatum]|uniref:Uncharacterized protein n=1 Tax=Colletotrichum truncatum TaxID=5467 RepID=A0ACC3ZGZ3_COLTU|nr:uncharacterized protein CTRU02_08082 [Colletotrichum truncatum]KAF6790562.1 hypothetical protein CTRU02_08082 [Colletotrichum truncatum]
MADPLSTAGTAVGITSLGIQVTQALFKYYNDVKDQPSDTSRTLKKLERLRQFFDRLESYLNSRDRDEELADEVIDAVQNCNECIEELQEILEKLEQVPGGSFQAAVRATGRRLAYPFKLGTLQKLDEEIDDAISHLSLVLSLLQQGAVDQIENDVEDIKAVLATVSASIVSSEIRDWLKAPDATINFNDACAKKHPGTGLWFVKGEEFSNWLKTRGSFLWLKGFAGCGKTVLSSTAIQYARRHQRSQSQIGLCFFYFTFNDETKQDDSAMLRALIIQLLSQLKTTPKFLKDLYDRQKNSMLPVTGLLECLHLLVAMFDDVYVILDALDESPALRARHLMLDTLQSMRDWRNLHLLVTSRELPEISDGIRASQLETIVMKNNVNEDIASFVSEHLRSDTALQKFKKYHARIEQVLTEKAQGVFRWVECQFIAIKQCPRSPYLIEKLLNSLPRTLDETYARMLQNIPSDFMEQAQQMLSILCCAVRPLTAPELIDALAVDAIVPLSTGALPKFDIDRRVENIDDLQKICPGFTEVVLEQETENATIRIAHFSVQEYLESDRITAHEKAAKYMVDVRKAHTMMAFICLSILLEEGLEDLDYRDVQKRYPLVAYGVNHWPHHYHNGISVIQLDQQAIALFTNRRRSLKTFVEIRDFERRNTHGTWLGHRPTALYYASLLGLSSVVKALFQEDYGVSELESFLAFDVLNMQFGDHGTPLEAAATEGHLDVVKFLLEKGANPNLNKNNHDARFLYGSPSLSAAISGGHSEVVELLLNAGARAYTTFRSKASKHIDLATEEAARKGRLRIVQILLEKGANLDQDVLNAACESGSSETVRLLLDEGASINAPIQDDYAVTALETACRHGHEGVVQLLLRRGAELTTRMSGGRTREALSVLEQSKSDDKSSMVRLLIHTFLKQDTDNSTLKSRFPTYLEAAIAIGNEKLLSSLLNKKINFSNFEGCGPALLEASAQGYVRIVEMLLDMGVDVNFRQQQPRWKAGPAQKRPGTALQNACRNGREEIVQLILKRGGDPNAPGVEDSYRGIMTALEEALSNGHKEIAKLLLANGAALNDTMKAGVLISASAKGQLHIVMFLLGRGADVNSKGAFHWTSLHAAAINGHKHIVQALLENGADVHSKERWNQTALAAASGRGQTGIVKILLQHGAGKDNQNTNANLWVAFSAALRSSEQDLVQLLFNELKGTTSTNLKCLKEHPEMLCNAAAGGYKDVVLWLLNSKVSASATLLYQAFRAALKAGQTEIVKTLLSQGASANSHSKDNMTPLIFATQHGFKAIVQLLLQAGAEINARRPLRFPHGRSGLGTATFLAAREGFTEILRILLSSGGDPNLEAEDSDQHSIFALQDATITKNKEVIFLLLEYGANVNAKPDMGTALYIASTAGQRELVELLLQHGADINMGLELLLKNGADVNAQGGDTGTAIIAASVGGDLEVVQILLKKGADINVKAGRFGTAIIAASVGGDLEVVQLLLKKGADINVKAERFGTAIIAASVGGDLEVVQLLLKKGADINVKAERFGTAIIAASARGHFNIVEFLLREGADVNIWGDGMFRTAFGAALCNNHTYVAMLLLENGASVSAALQLALEGGHKRMAKKLLPLVLNIDSQTFEDSSGVHISMVNKFVDISRRIIEANENFDEYSDEHSDGEDQNYHATPLQIAVLEGCKDAVDLTLQYGADPNGPQWGLGAPLQIAASLGHEDLVTLLLQHDADIHRCQGERYRPALLGALLGRHLKVAELLLEKGADITNDCNRRGTVLQMAAYEGDVFAAEFLIRHGADLNASRSWNLGPPLYGAVSGGHKEMVALLLDHGADANIGYEDYEDVLSAALEAGHQNIIELLTERGVERRHKSGGPLV